MTTTGLDSFDTTVQKTNVWLHEIMDDLNWDDRHRAYLALRAVLHTLRDRLTAEEAVEFGAQLPMLIRGLYYEGWNPAGKPDKTLHHDEFLARVREAFRFDPEIDEEKVVRTVFHILVKRISAGELQDIRDNLPKDLLGFWEQE